MKGTNRIVTAALVAIVILLAVIAIRPYVIPEFTVTADAGRFDYVQIIAATYLYQGRQGVLMLDKRNGNVWFTARGDNVNISFTDPVFIVRVPLEKLDQQPQPPQ